MSNNQRDSISMLLPWYVNESLTEQERKQVDAQLSADLVLNRELRQEQALAALIAQAQPEQISARLALSKLHASIRAERPLSVFRRLRHWIVGRPLAAIAACLALLTIGGLWLGLPTSPKTFETLSEPQPVIEAPVVLRVVFRQHVQAPQAAALAEKLGGRIVDGPSPNGVYTIAPRDGADPQRWLAKWRESPDLRFAELITP